MSYRALVYFLFYLPRICAHSFSRVYLWNTAKFVQCEERQGTNIKCHFPVTRTLDTRLPHYCSNHLVKSDAPVNFKLKTQV